VRYRSASGAEAQRTVSIDRDFHTASARRSIHRSAVRGAESGAAETTGRATSGRRSASPTIKASSSAGCIREMSVSSRTAVARPRRGEADQQSASSIAPQAERKCGQSDYQREHPPRWRVRQHSLRFPPRRGSRLREIRRCRHAGDSMHDQPRSSAAASLSRASVGEDPAYAVPLTQHTQLKTPSITRSPRLTSRPSVANHVAADGFSSSSGPPRRS